MLAGLGVPVWEVIAEILRVERGDLQPACVRNPSPALACERLAVLAALDDNALRNMTEAELDFVETEWVRELANAKGSEQP